MGLLERLYLSVAEAVRNVVTLFVNPAERLFWLYALTSLLMAVAALRLAAGRAEPGERRGIGAILRTLFDRAVWFHRSAVTDYLCYAINTMLATMLGLSGLAAGALLGSNVHSGLLALNGGVAVGLPAGAAALAAYTLVSLLIIDFGRFFGHFLMHRVPVLWEIHKVHHSAQVLTPLTAYRVHPLEFMFTGFVTGCFIGLSGALGLFAFGAEVSPVGIFGLNLGVFLFYLLGANLRHSHVWLPYPGWLSRILISPAQHQIHHSNMPKHFDRNFGVLFAVWDWLVGSLYIPAGREEITYGLADGEDEEYQTIAALYLLPLRKAWLRLKHSAIPGHVSPLFGTSDVLCLAPQGLDSPSKHVRYFNAPTTPERRQKWKAS